jgi:hypothetical protein
MVERGRAKGVLFDRIVAVHLTSHDTACSYHPRHRGPAGHVSPMQGRTATASHVAHHPRLPAYLAPRLTPPFSAYRGAGGARGHSFLPGLIRDMAVARWLVLLLTVSAAAVAAGKHERWRTGGGQVVVEKERRRVVAASDAGTVTAVDVLADAEGTAYRLHFITMGPGALFLPVQLHADMVFYVHSGTCHACLWIIHISWSLECTTFFLPLPL